MFNNNTTATCPQSVPVKKFWKSINIWWRYGQSQSGTFFWDTMYMTLDCVRPTQFSVIQTIHCNVGLKCFFNFYQNVRLLLSLCMHILLGSVEMHLQCGGICNNHVIANCLQSVPVKNFFENRSIIGEDMDKSKVSRFLAHSV